MTSHYVATALALVVPTIAGVREAASEPAESSKTASGVSARYDDGLKLASEDGQFEIGLGFRDQVRFTSTRPLDEGSQFSNAFSIPRARFVVEGHFFGEDNRFKLETSLGDEGSYAFLKDVYIESRVAGSGVFVRAGQWKRPFNRAELVSDFESEFNERSIQNELAGGGRSIGIALHDQYEESPRVEWVVGMFNTFNGGSDRPSLSTACTSDPVTGDIDCVTIGPTTVPSDFGPTIVTRLGFNSPDMNGYSEADLEGGPLRYAIAASYKVDLANFGEGDEDSWADNTSHGLELDTMIKVKGFSFEGGVVMMKIKTEDPQFGLYVEPGMMVIPKKLQLVARFALVTVTEAIATGAVDRNEVEARAAVNYYFHGHSWKLASDAGFVVLTGDEPTDDDPDLQLRLMLQIAI